MRIVDDYIDIRRRDVGRGVYARPLRFDVEIVGAGDPVILVHGLGSSPRVWDGLVRSLRKSHEVHILHIGGFDGMASLGNESPGALLSIAGELVDYATRLEAPSVIGHSMGGLIAMIAAHRDPSAIAQVMVVDMLPFFSVLLHPFATIEHMEPLASMARAEMLSQDKQAFEDSQQAAMLKLARTPNAIARALKWSLAADRRTMANMMYEVMTTDLRHRLFGITAPMTVLYAYDEDMGYSRATVSGVYAMNYRGARNAKMRRIEAARHYVMLDQPDVFVQEVELFLS